VDLLPHLGRQYKVYLDENFIKGFTQTNNHNFQPIKLS